MASLARSISKRSKLDTVLRRHSELHGEWRPKAVMNRRALRQNGWCPSWHTVSLSRPNIGGVAKRRITGAAHIERRHATRNVFNVDIEVRLVGNEEHHLRAVSNEPSDELPSVLQNDALLDDSGARTRRIADAIAAEGRAIFSSARLSVQCGISPRQEGTDRSGTRKDGCADPRHAVCSGAVLQGVFVTDPAFFSRARKELKIAALSELPICA